jgi:hypothetical protein
MKRLQKMQTAQPKLGSCHCPPAAVAAAVAVACVKLQCFQYPDYTALNEWMINELKRICKEVIMD